MGRILFSLLVCLVARLPHAEAEEQLHYPFPIDSKVQAEDVTTALHPVLKSGYFASPRTYDELIAYHRTALARFTSLYPPDTFPRIEYDVVQPFSDRARFAFPEIHELPFFPITVLVQDTSKMKFFTLRTAARNKTIPGFRVTSSLAPRYRAVGQRMVDLAYLPTVNARVLGFSWGLLAKESTANITAAPRFAYNGLIEWKLHQRNGPEDQFTRGVELTNFTHLLPGATYTVSVHPDFAVQWADDREASARFTFFLWKERPKEGEAPDFVFEVILE